MHNLFLVYLFLAYLSISVCFGWLCAHHQEKQLYLCNTWYAGWNEIPPCIPDSHPYRIAGTKCHTNSYFSWIWAHSRPKHVEIDKYTKNKYSKLCTKLALFTRLHIWHFFLAWCPEKLMYHLYTVFHKECYVLHKFSCKIWGLHTGIMVDYSLLGYDAASKC